MPAAGSDLRVQQTELLFSKTDVLKKIADAKEWDKYWDTMIAMSRAVVEPFVR